MKRQHVHLVFFAACVVLLLVADCTDPAGTQPSGGDSIRFLDKGAVVPDPVSTLVTIDQVSIRYFSSRGGGLLENWSLPVSTEDYLSLISIIERFALQNAPDPVLPQGVMGCEGGRGTVITLLLNGRIDTLNISGPTMCLHECWPLGLDSLMDFEKALVEKYKNQGRPL